MYTRIDMYARVFVLRMCFCSFVCVCGGQPSHLESTLRTLSALRYPGALRPPSTGVAGARPPEVPLPSLTALSAQPGTSTVGYLQGEYSEYPWLAWVPAGVASRAQLPLMLAFALTVHKAQVCACVRACVCVCVCA